MYPSSEIKRVNSKNLDGMRLFKSQLKKSAKEESKAELVNL